MGVASLVLGILALIVGVVGGAAFGWLGIIMGIVGIILGALGRKNPEKKGISTGGLVCSIIGTILSALVYIACVACIGGAANALSSM